ncbi:MAG TPA: M20 family metallopeptidase [Streptosporangiaceae bacterium]|nr:M20 family metallopeptidase [Streptosporangiaceae bacterium]
MSVQDDATAIGGELAGLRRQIHQDPEIGLDLPRTQAKVLAALDGLPLEVTQGRTLSSVTGVLRGAQPGPTVLLRGDMDALPITERTGLPYASSVTGVMHACGHDLHTAMLVGAARILSARQAELPGNVIFMFQPGEEGLAGAAHMITEGVLDAAGGRPVAAYALHAASAQFPPGMFATRPGSMMAAADILDVTVRGHGGHASQPHLAQDPIPAACEMVTALQTLVTRGFDVFDPVVITVGSFHAGTADNIIPDEAHFLATVRSFSGAARDRVRAASLRLIADLAAAHGLRAEAEYLDGYPVTVNDAAETAFAAQAVADMFGEDRLIAQANPLPGAEDFSFVLGEVPGVFLMLGAGPEGSDPGTAPFNHAADAVFDDAVLPDGAALLAELALRRLSAPPVP